MTERIREIGKQLGMTDTEGKFYSPNYEILAEEIIRECHDAIKKDMELAQIQLLPLDFGMYANGRLRRIIKQHFGVE